VYGDKYAAKFLGLVWKPSIRTRGECLEWERRVRFGLNCYDIVHNECLQFFIRHCPTPDRYDRLWVANLRRKFLWPDSQYLDVLAELEHDFRQAANSTSSLHLSLRSLPSFVVCTEQLGFSKIRSLPVEVVQMIQQFAHPNNLRRFIRAMDLARKLSSLPRSPQGEEHIPFDRIISWNRGHAPVLFLLLFVSPLTPTD
jgi:hypothetical protein